MAMTDRGRKDPEIARLLAAAQAAQQSGDTAAAQRQLEQVLERDPDNPGALNSLGMQALARNDFAAAEQLFERAAEADPSAPPLWVNLATARRGRGDAEGERQSLLRVLDLDQRHLTANFRLAELHERLGEAAQAMHRWSGVLAICQAIPNRPPALNDLLNRAQAFVAGKSAEFGAIVDRGLEKVRESVDGAERRRFDACVDAMLGRRRIYYNECAGLHFPFLPADEFFDRSHFPWMPQIEAATDVIRAEFEALVTEELEGFTPYVAMEPGTPPNLWSGLDHSLDWSAYFLWRHAKRYEDACERCPQTAKALEALPLADMPGRAPTAFFSVLRPKTRLPAHTGVSNVRTVIHLPLIVPQGCGFRVGGQTREWRVGEAFAFDDTIEHEAWNDSDALRAVLIFEVWNPHLSEVERQLLRVFFAVADTSGFDPSRTAVGD
jgi:aspartyl/asparaginyl beta-hydroxylase (cupin superfamily)